MNLNVKYKSIKLLDNIRENFQDLGLGKESKNLTLKARSKKEKINKLDFTKIKNLCSTKEYAKRMKGQATEKICANHIINKKTSI